MEEQRINHIWGSCAHEASGDKFTNLAEGQSCHILAKNLVTFCLSPMSLSKAEFNIDGLVNLFGENLKTGLYSGHVMMIVHSSDSGLQWEKNKQRKGYEKCTSWRGKYLE